MKINKFGFVYIAALALALAFGLAGCDTPKQTRAKVTVKPNAKTALTEPYTKIRVWDRGLRGDMADVWFEAEKGDTFGYDQRSVARGFRPTFVSVKRKDGTTWSLPMEVADPETGDMVKVHTFHMNVKGREVNFLKF